jgi:type IV pilus assembly protein PilE
MMHSRVTLKAFTLLELLIAVSIIGILASIAYPNYTSYVATAHKNGAMTAILNAQIQLEGARLNYPSFVEAVHALVLETSDNYRIEFDQLGVNTYRITAIASEHVNIEARCGQLSINERSQKSPQHCWN